LALNAALAGANGPFSDFLTMSAHRPAGKKGGEFDTRRIHATWMRHRGDLQYEMIVGQCK
jgi:hypothetical protein